MNKLKSISIWLWFGLTLSLVPIFLVIWKTSNTTQFPTIYKAGKESIRHGELLLLSIASIGTSIGELFREETKYKIARIWIAGLSLSLFLFATMSYSEIKNVNLDKGVDTSLNIFYGMILLTLATLILPKK